MPLQKLYLVVLKYNVDSSMPKILLEANNLTNTSGYSKKIKFLPYLICVGKYLPKFFLKTTNLVAIFGKFDHIMAIPFVVFLMTVQFWLWQLHTNRFCIELIFACEFLCVLVYSKQTKFFRSSDTKNLLSWIGILEICFQQFKIVCKVQKGTKC